MNIFFDLLKTVCNLETIYNMYSVIETNYVSSGLLFIYFYYIRVSSIAFFITVVISRVIQCIYSCYRCLNQEHQGIDKNTFSRSRKSGYFILGSAVVIGWLGFAVLCNQKHIENEYELINWECKIVCVKSNCADLFYAPYWGKQLKGWISNGKT